MYVTKKLVCLPEEIGLPTCIYKTNQFDIQRKPEFNATNEKNASKVLSTSFIELEIRQKEILEKLNEFQNKLDSLMDKTRFSTNLTNAHSSTESKQNAYVQDIVINADAFNPPFFLLFLLKSLKENGIKINMRCSVHSSLSKVNSELLELFEDGDSSRKTSTFSFLIQWKNQQRISLMIDPLKQNAILGEANIIRYLSRLFPLASLLNYEAQGSFSYISETDYWLDGIQNKLIEGSNEEKFEFLKRIDSRLSKNFYIDGENYGVSDVLAWSSILNMNKLKDLPLNVNAWFKKMKAIIQIPNLKKEAPFDSLVNSSLNGRFYDRASLECFLRELGINYQVRDHPEAFTVTQLLTHVSDMPGLHMKNLFLKDKKKNLFLLCVRHDFEVNLICIGKIIGAKDLRFGLESTLFECLGVKQGCVTIFALVNDSRNRVKLLLDSEALNSQHSFVNFHPMTNSATLGIRPTDLKVFLEKSGHKPIIINM